MRLSALFLTALIVPALLSGQTFPDIADVSRTLNIIQPGMEIQSIAVDPTGNVYLAGVSASGFTGATTQLGPRGDFDLFVIKTNATVDQVLYATAIGGSGAESLRSIKVDAAGSVYLLASTISTDFPSITKTNPSLPIGAVAMKLNPAGTQFVYAIQMGSRMTAIDFDLDSAGAAFIVGAANTIDLATTPGVIKPAPTSTGGQGDNMGFIAKLAPAGTSFQIATFFGPVDRSVEQVSVRSNGILIIADGNLVLLNNTLTAQTSSVATGMTSPRMAFDGAGNVHLTGRSTAAGNPFALKRFAATGLAVNLDKTYPMLATPTPRIAVTNAGRIYLFGQPAQPSFPTLNGSQPCLANIAAPNGAAGLPVVDSGGGLIGTVGAPIPPDQAILVLDTAGETVYSTFTPTVVSNIAVAPTNGRIYTASSQTRFTDPRTTWSGVMRINQELVPANSNSPSCVVHGATFNAVRVSPGALMTIFGSNLGPAAFTSFDLVNGLVPTTLGGVSVTVDNKAAPMLFSWEKQINFIVPWTIRTDGTAVPLCVTVNGAQKCVQVGTTTAVTGAFQRGAIAAALNQDGSIHETTNPAAPGTVVQLFMTGFGAVDGTLVDGGVAGGTLQFVRGQTTATTEPPPTGGCGLFVCAAEANAQKQVEVGFAGAAPGLVLGVNQVNIRVPEDMPSGLQTFTINFKPTGSTTTVSTDVKLQIR